MEARGPEPPTLVASESERPGVATLHLASRAVRPEVRVGDQIGRFMVLGRLGGGSMGVVYSAYDDVLDRKVAVKIVRRRGAQRDEQSRLRLVREAQAMARLSHPNVVAVYEAGLAGDEVFVAMEFVHGQTLFAWAASPHSWQEVLAVYVQAARGLAAAHAAGLVHRDFKPGNVMLGVDGRVRVLDFGLVQPLRQAPMHAETQADADAVATTSMIQSFLGQRLTYDGQVMGTPAYMSPEQLSGAAIDPKSDQFSFCAALYEGLYGELPFRSASIPELIASIRAGKVREPPRAARVPNWLRRVLLRGLAGDPSRRYPSMEALLSQLDRRPVRLRRTLAAGLVTAAVSGFALARASDGGALCSGASEALGDAWDASRRGALQDSFAALGPGFSRDLWPPLSGALDAYAEGWVEAHRDACLASQRGEQSDAMLDRRMACLSRSRSALDHTTRLLTTVDRDLGIRALELVHALPPLPACGDVQALSSAVATAPPASAEAVSALRDDLARAQTYAIAGRAANARLELDEALATARRLGYAPVLAEVLLARGRLELGAAGERKESDMLTEAFLAAVAAGDDELATEALALRLYVRGRIPGMAAAASEDISLAEAFLSRLPRPERVHSLLLNNIGTVHLAAGDVAAARSYFQQALDAHVPDSGAGELQRAYTLMNLALVATTHEERARQMRTVLEVFDENLGRVHPRTVDARISASMYVLDPRAAVDLLAPGCDALDSLWPENLPLRARCRLYLGLHEAEAGSQSAAAEHLHSAESLLALASPDTLSGLSWIGERARITGYAALFGEPTAVGRALRRVEDLLSELSHLEQNDWTRRERAEVELILGLLLGRGGHSKAAIVALEAAIRGFESARATARDVSLEQHLSLTHLSLAEQLLGAGDPHSASEHAHSAFLWYRGAGPSYSWRLPLVHDLRSRIQAVMGL